MRDYYRNQNGVLRLILLSTLLLLIPTPLIAVTEWDELSDESRRWTGPDGRPLPFVTDQQALDFLATARVVSRKRIGAGINNPWKVLLEANGVQAHAVFRDVQVEKDQIILKKKGLRRDFRDDALFEVAAYRLSRHLGMWEVPPTVERSLMGQRGSLQLWIENALTERVRHRDKLRPVRLDLWRTELQILHLFDSLILNDDRNMGNILFDPDWNLWMIDHTRAFQLGDAMPNFESFHLVERVIWERLPLLEKTALEEDLGRYLSPRQIRDILHRRDLIVERLQQLIDERGERLVIFERVQPAPALLAATTPPTLPAH